MLRHKRLAVTDEQKIYDKCDKLYPSLRHGQLCRCCLAKWRYTPADCIHHIIHRANPITRFYLYNLIPLCSKCHDDIHNGKIKEPISEDHRQHLVDLSNKSLKGICILRGITKAEYYQEQLEIIKKMIQ